MVGTFTPPDGPMGYPLHSEKSFRLVPTHERHKWSTPKLQRGEHTTCAHCGCVKRRRADYAIRYQLPGQPQWVQQRPVCTRKQVGSDDFQA